MLKLGELAAKIGAELRGDADCVIQSVATIQNAHRGDITFLSNPRYRKYLASTEASAVILSAEDQDLCPVAALVTPDPYLAYARVASLLYPIQQPPSGIHSNATVFPGGKIHETAYIGPHSVVEEGAEIGPGVFIGPGCVIGRNAVIGEGSRLTANVTICHGVRIGRRALIHPGAVIGADGFGLANDKGAWMKVPQLGSVMIGDDVEIGANTTIDRGALEDTVIEDGVKLDNLIQVGHNVRIGAHTAIAACTGIAGSARIGRHCTIGGGVGIVGHLEIADGVCVTGMSFVAHSITEPGVYSSGTPLEPNAEWHKNYARFRQLNAMARRLSAVENAVKELKEAEE